MNNERRHIFPAWFAPSYGWASGRRRLCRYRAYWPLLRCWRERRRMTRTITAYSPLCHSARRQPPQPSLSPASACREAGHSSRLNARWEAVGPSSSSTLLHQCRSRSSWRDSGRRGSSWATTRRVSLHTEIFSRRYSRSSQTSGTPYGTFSQLTPIVGITHLSIEFHEDW